VRRGSSSYECALQLEASPVSVQEYGETPQLVTGFLNPSWRSIRNQYHCDAFHYHEKRFSEKAYDDWAMWLSERKRFASLRSMYTDVLPPSSVARPACLPAGCYLFLFIHMQFEFETLTPQRWIGSAHRVPFLAPQIV